MFYVFFTIAVIFAITCDAYDVTMTTRGLRAAVGTEANDWLVGRTPSASVLYLRDYFIIALASLPALLVYVFHNHALAYGMLTGPVVAGVKHILGGLAWSKLLRKA